jgi:2-desacetyl-2-hydroxyethyl bacteriochlorophyllide A dehydrogenase
MGETARALWFTAPGRVEIREETVAPAPGQLLVFSELIGISHGTEMLFFRGAAPEDAEADLTIPALGGGTGYPIKYGYINVGRSESGDRVFAFYPHQDRFALAEDETIRIPGGVGPEDAVFLAHMETALGIVHDAAPLAGESILIFGQGTVGLLAAEVLARFPGVRVISVEPSETRRKASEAAGCVSLPPGGKELAERVLDLTGGRGADAAIDTSGAPAALQTAIDPLAFEGTVVEASWFGGTRVPLDLGRAFHRKRLAIRSSQVSRLSPGLSGRWDKKRRLALALELLRETKPSKYITHRIPLEQAQKAFDLIASGGEGMIQVVLVP